MNHPTSSFLESRRQFLGRGVGGIGGLAFGWLLAQEGQAAGMTDSPYAPKVPIASPRVKRVIHIAALGGVSHVDTFDFKPELERRHGLDAGRTFDTFFGQPGKLLKSPFTFRQYGQSGRWVSDLLPQLAQCVDDLTFIHSMHSKSSNHTPATFLMNSGFTMNGFPSAGAWVSYGLGSENQNLPAFVVLPDPRQLPAGGAINWTNGFLPGVHQGVAFRSGVEPIPDLHLPPDTTPAARADSVRFLQKLNEDFSSAHPEESALAARIRAYELAAQMQLSVPDLVALDRESDTTKQSYGLNHPNPATAGFARNCLLARRLSERGVRFVQIFNGGQFGSPRINWDAHEDLPENHRKQAVTMDQPVAGLLQDLKTRGLLEETVVLWTTEFGRTPITQGIDGKGRDHHQHGFTIFLAGAGLKPGFAYGATDEIGYSAARDPVEFYDVHATLLHLLGLDHTKLTFRHNGVDRRLTDVHGEVIQGILA
ncbi:MAG TPA: DUF1501 domain-containing protein [Verrucomicrobiota bacterium]|nr:DUF1501 domain-containing protein [Verrucomicrobiales bacterium]HRI15892.1 DUF1501 domain-containing protein [Verrucomicrobiota bacterium]